VRVKICWTSDASGTLEFDTDETEPEKIIEEFYREGVPGLCAQCSGWGRSHSMEVGDEIMEERDEEGYPVIYVGGKRYEPWKDEK
jgi:hypothetical protein